MTWMFEPGPGMDLDEDDVRIRPNPKGSKPRTKRRPTHDDALMGMVLEVHLARYKVLTEDGREVLATLAKELRNKGCVTCDRVALAGEVSDQKGTLARIVRIEPRTTELTRSSDESDTGDQTIVANADQLAIVMAATNPEPKPRLVDRYLVAAMHSGLKPILIMTKCDLTDPTDFIEGFDGFDLKVIRHSQDKPELEDLEELLAGKTTVFVGHSGVGKTSLINLLAPDYVRATGEVNEVTGKGKHTSSSAKAIPVRDGWIVDTPGVRTFGLAGIDAIGLLKGFADLDSASAACPRDCSHLADSPDCELDVAVEAGKLSASRLDSFRRLVLAIGSID
jgi:ribosome biogenesis GTPase